MKRTRRKKEKEKEKEIKTESECGNVVKMEDTTMGKVFSVGRKRKMI